MKSLNSPSQETADIGFAGAVSAFNAGILSSNMYDYSPFPSCKPRTSALLHSWPLWTGEYLFISVQIKT